MVIPAAGSGRRMGGVDKPFLELDGRALLDHVLQRFLGRDDVVHIVVALPAALAAGPPPWILRDPRVAITTGGDERTDSVRNALAALADDVDVILVHDAARPLVAPDVIDRCVAGAARGRATVAAVAVTDTIQQVDDGGRIVATPERPALRSAQTPQAFPAAVLRAAHARAAADGVTATDDAALVARYANDVYVVEGDVANIKITTPADLVVARALLEARR